MDAAMGLVATGRTPGGDMKGDLSTAVANIGLVRAMAKVEPNSSNMAKDLMNAGVPSNQKPMAKSTAAGVAKLPGGASSAMEAWLTKAGKDSSNEQQSEPTKSTRETDDEKFAKSQAAYKKKYEEDPVAARNAEILADKKKFYDRNIKEAKAAGPEKQWMVDMLEKKLAEANDEYGPADFNQSAGTTRADESWSDVLGNAIEAGGERIMDATEEIGINDVIRSAMVGALAAPGLAMSAAEDAGGMGEVMFESGAQAIKSAKEAAMGAAKGFFAEAKLVRDNAVGKAENIAKVTRGVATEGVGEAGDAFEQAKNALGQSISGMEGMLADMATAFDAAKEGAESYIDALPAEAQKELEGAWSEAKKLGEAADTEMANLQSKMQQAVIGAQEILAPKPEDPNKPSGGAVPKSPEAKIKEGMMRKDGSKVEAKGSNVKVKAFPKGIMDHLQEASPALASGITNLMSRITTSRKEAIEAAAPFIAQANKALDSASDEAEKAYEEANAALNSAAESSMAAMDAGLESMTSMFNRASEALTTLSDSIDAEALKSGQVWVETYIRETGEKVEGFWRKAAKR